MTDYPIYRQKPADYNRRKGILDLISSVFWHIVIAVLVLFIAFGFMASGIESGQWIGEVLMAVTMPVLFLLIYRKYWKWTNNYLHCYADTGILLEDDKENRWLNIAGSTPDGISLKSSGIDTNRRFIQMWLFRNTYDLKVKGAGGEVFRNVVDPAGIVAIREYLAGSDRETTDYLKTLVSLAEEAKLSELRMMALATEAVQLLRQIVDNRSPALPDDTSEFSALPSADPPA